MSEGFIIMGMSEIAKPVFLAVPGNVRSYIFRWHTNK